ncbi:alanine racemase [Strigomonas culicis]|uniref:Alanine racemase n=1 Tax=Strigomonas culicis TaxID=28005 RepID=S9W8R6_9TRYP|nr:alanine racemase [Strigomonas culicis]|eukprot:EPY35606.1 alanine racemase [Strigomonas culicis]
MLRYSSHVEIRLPNIQHNINRIREFYAPKATIIAMIKGQGYGNGLAPVGGYLHESCDIHHFGVATLGEAHHLLQSCPSIDAKGNHVFVCSDTEILNPAMQSAYEEQNRKAASGAGAQLWPILGTRGAVEHFCAQRRTTFADTPLCVKLNTGMNRLGLPRAELEALVPLLRASGGVDLLLQHFSISGAVGHPACASQYECFQRAKAFLRDAGVAVRATSASNSGAIEQGLGVEETYVRPGIMLYGPSSLDPATMTPGLRPWDGKACGFFYTKVLHRHVVRAGEHVGYGVRDNQAREDMVVVVVPTGYADGFSRFYKGMPVCVSPALPRGADEDLANLQGQIMGRVFGNVNMDMAAIAVVPSEVGRDIETLLREIRPETTVLLWGQDIGAKATAVNTIPYELMCGLTERIPRVYVQ